MDDRILDVFEHIVRDTRVEVGIGKWERFGLQHARICERVV
jgi:hypothetical protein